MHVMCMMIMQAAGGSLEVGVSVITFEKCPVPASFTAATNISSVSPRMITQ